MAEYNFPTETIDLPSKGTLYPEGSPLRSGQVDVKYMTAKEEDILTSTNLLAKGLVIDKLLESLLVTAGVTPDDLYSGDLDAVMVASRILAYGKDYPIALTCEKCSTVVNHTVDLTALESVTPDELSNNGEYSLALPSGVSITYRLLTRGNEKIIKAEIEAMKKFNSIEAESTTRLRYMLTSIGGNKDKKVIRDFSEAMIMRDVRALREHARTVSPSVNFNLEIGCTKCSHVIEARMPFGANFFWPDIDG